MIAGDNLREIAGSAGTLSRISTMQPPYIWRLAPSSAKLPQGLKLNRRSGAITGKPNQRDSGTFPFTVEVLDKKTSTKPLTQDVTTKALSITVS